jgi:hypothetical protein
MVRCSSTFATAARAAIRLGGYAALDVDTAWTEACGVAGGARRHGQRTIEAKDDVGDADKVGGLRRFSAPSSPGAGRSQPSVSSRRRPISQWRCLKAGHSDDLGTGGRCTCPSAGEKARRQTRHRSHDRLLRGHRLNPCSARTCIARLCQKIRSVSDTLQASATERRA